MAKIPQAEYNCTQPELYSTVRLMLSNYTANLADFTGYKAKYTAPFGAALATAVDSAEALPDKETRDAVAETLRTELVTLNAKCCDNWQRLKGYITEVFTPESLKTNLDAAGARNYSDALNQNWEKAVEMNVQANAFIAANTVKLDGGGLNMPAGFPLTYKTDAKAFSDKYEEYKPATETTVATTDKINANNSVFHQAMDVCADGQIIYRLDAVKSKLFTWSEIIKVITPPGVTALTITVLEDETGHPIVNADVIAQQAGDPVLLKGVTDAAGQLTFKNINAGDWKTLAKFAGRNDAGAVKSVTAGGNARLELRMTLV